MRRRRHELDGVGVMQRIRRVKVERPEIDGVENRVVDDVERDADETAAAEIATTRVELDVAIRKAEQG